MKAQVNFDALGGGGEPLPDFIVGLGEWDNWYCAANTTTRFDDSDIYDMLVGDYYIMYARGYTSNFRMYLASNVYVDSTDKVAIWVGRRTNSEQGVKMGLYTTVAQNYDVKWVECRFS